MTSVLSLVLTLFLVCLDHIVCIGVSNLPQKDCPLFLAQSPLNVQTVHAPPPFRQFPPLYWFLMTPPPQYSSFSLNPKNINFFYPVLSFKRNQILS